MTNRFARSAAALALMTFAVASTAGAQNTQIINFSVAVINQIAVTGTVTLDITTAVAGSGLTQATDDGSKWAVTTNQTGAKITAALDSDMPDGLTLKVALDAPPVGSTTGAQILSSASSLDLVTGVSQTKGNSLGMHYTLDADLTAGNVASGSRTVTYTIASGA